MCNSYFIINKIYKSSFGGELLPEAKQTYRGLRHHLKRITLAFTFSTNRNEDTSKMASDEELRENLLWAETIVQDRQNNTKQRADTTGKLKVALYIFCAVIIIIALIYILHRAYKIPEPPSILDEVRDMTNQTIPSDIDCFDDH